MHYLFLLSSDTAVPATDKALIL